MVKHHETFPHTADIGIRATADTLGELYEALAEGLADVTCPCAQVQKRDGRALVVESENAESLAIDFLARVLTTITADRFCVAEVQATAASPTRIQAILLGERYDPLRHELGPEVKAVTYHMLRVVQEEGRWAGQVVLDL